MKPAHLFSFLAQILILRTGLSSAEAAAPSGSLIVNGSFEAPVIAGSFQLFSSIPGWQPHGRVRRRYRDRPERLRRRRRGRPVRRAEYDVCERGGPGGCDDARRLVLAGLRLRGQAGHHRGAEPDGHPLRRPGRRPARPAGARCGARVVRPPIRGHRHRLVGHAQLPGTDPPPAMAGHRARLRVAGAPGASCGSLYGNPRVAAF